MGPGMAAFCSAAPSPKARKNARHLSQVKHGAAAQLPAGPASSPWPRRDPSLPLGMSHLPHREQRPTHRLLPDGDAGMRPRTIDLTLSILASTAALLLSWPYWRAFEYWPDSRLAWILYLIVGFALAGYRTGWPSGGKRGVQQWRK